MIKIHIRQEAVGDLPCICNLVKSAFENVQESDHLEHELVDRLHLSETYIPELSLVAENAEGNIVGYIQLTKLEIRSEGNVKPSLALAPLAVHPDYQRLGIGAQLLDEAHRQAASLGHESIILLGHADYYPRFGYRRAMDYGIEFPFDAPLECCMVKELCPGALNTLAGTVHYPVCFGV